MVGRCAEMLVKCDSCGFEHELSGPDDIRTQPFEFREKKYVIDFLLCPSCKHVDIVCIKDAKYFRLAKELEKARKRIAKMHKIGANSQNYAHAVRSAFKKQERLGKHVDGLKAKFHGVFTVEDAKLSDGSITDCLVYHETV